MKFYLRKGQLLMNNIQLATKAIGSGENFRLIRAEKWREAVDH